METPQVPPPLLRGDGEGDRMGGGIGLDIPTSIDIYNMYIVHT
jgi:hypothetical protein